MRQSMYPFHIWKTPVACVAKAITSKFRWTDTKIRVDNRDPQWLSEPGW